MNECNHSFSPSERNKLLVAAAASGTSSLLLCTLAISILIALRLYKHLVYRLAMYQVLAALFRGFSICLFFMLYGYRNSLYYRVSCKFTAFFMQHCVWVELIFTSWLTLHLFCYIIFFKNLKRFEWLYLSSSVLVPLLFDWIPFIHNSYGVSGAWCYIRSWEDNCATVKYIEGIAEQFALFYGPASVFLTLNTIAVVIMFAVSLRRVCKNSEAENEPLNDKNQYFKVMKQLLPLLAYPIIYFVLFIFPFVDRTYMAVSNRTSYSLAVVHGVSYSSTGVFIALTLLVHIGMVKWKSRAKPLSRSRDCDKGYSTFEGVTPYTSGAATNFSLPYESEVDGKILNRQSL